jgi:hypothetical protein
MEINVNPLWVIIPLMFIPLAYFIGHFRGWVSAQKDINDQQNFDNE